MIRQLKERLRKSKHKTADDGGLAENDLVFLHIGKNAGTQVVHLSNQINEKQSDVRIIKYKHSQHLKDLPAGHPYFFSVRNPISRFRSSFYSRYRKGQPRLYNEWSPAEEKAFGRFEHANELAEALFCEGEEGAQAYWAMNSIGHVNSFQGDWFEWTGFTLEDRPPVWIIRQERFEEDFARFVLKLDVGLTMDDLSLATDEKSAHAFNYGTVPDLSDLAKQNLARWYANDIALYDACETWLEQQQ